MKNPKEGMVPNDPRDVEMVDGERVEAARKLALELRASLKDVSIQDLQKKLDAGGLSEEAQSEILFLISIKKQEG